MNSIHENNKIKPSVLPLSIFLSLCGISASVSAGVIADKEAPSHQQADIKNTTVHFDCRTPGGCGRTTIVNIQSPDDNGLSHNKYTKFNAPGTSDVITLNNKLSSEENGNPHLKGAPARVILNEVNSYQKSQLNGVVSIAGQDAHIIIANPSGIDCNGCLSTSITNATLTTGNPLFNNGKLEGFNVMSGGINIHGFSERDTPLYLKMYSYDLKASGNFYADGIDILAGGHQIKVDSDGNPSGFKKISDRLDKANKYTAVDISDVGGMYAKRVRVISDANVIKNPNMKVADGKLYISAKGDIYNSDKKMTIKDKGIHRSGYDTVYVKNIKVKYN
ncbi:Large exoprotein involved in heme utilization or adhesion [Yersinia frederiksenii]|nr:Large exoprotein involved in heme utilization or adhesion [Yersinia frederiksenii]